MGTHRAKPFEVTAAYFDGSGSSAARLVEIAHGAGVAAVREMHKGSWNDGTPELWLKVGMVHVAPEFWAVIYEDGSVDAFSAEDFEDQFEVDRPIEFDRDDAASTLRALYMAAAREEPFLLAGREYRPTTKPDVPIKLGA